MLVSWRLLRCAEARLRPWLVCATWPSPSLWNPVSLLLVTMQACLCVYAMVAESACANQYVWSSTLVRTILKHLLGDALHVVSGTLTACHATSVATTAWEYCLRMHCRNRGPAQQATRSRLAHHMPPTYARIT